MTLPGRGGVVDAHADLFLAGEAEAEGTAAAVG